MSLATPLEPRAIRADEPASRECVDVWWIALEPTPAEAAREILGETERASAARLRAGSGEWVSARAALRRVLGAQLGIAPRDVALETGTNGKLRLAAGARPDVRFNLSHSGGLALIAVRLGAEVGADLEQVRPGVDGAAISRHVFGEDEREALRAIGGGESAEAFFRFWVRREALAKASGRGVASASPSAEAARYTVVDLEGVPGFAAAIASEGAGWNVRRR